MTVAFNLFVSFAILAIKVLMSNHSYIIRSFFLRCELIFFWFLFIIFKTCSVVQVDNNNILGTLLL